MKPLWRDAPVWAQWMAMDGDGDWFWYETEPHYTPSSYYADGVLCQLSWYPETEHCQIEFACGEAEDAAEDAEAIASLEKRP